jgi:hypothetical protein
MTDKTQRIEFLKSMRELRLRGLGHEVPELKLAFGLLSEEDSNRVMQETCDVMSNVERLLPDAKYFEDAMETRLKKIWILLIRNWDD